VKKTAKKKDGVVRYQLAEEEGLVTLTLAALSGRAPSWGVRLRLQPPKTLLREDGHLFDTAEAAPFEKKVIAAADAPWTDTVIGRGRVTVSFAASSSKQASAIAARLEALDVKPWKIEAALVDGANAARLRARRDEASLFAEPEVKPDARLAKALGGEKPAKPGLLARCGLDTRNPSLATVKKGLVWLHSELERLEPLVLPSFPEAPKGARLGAVINTHPRQRRFFFAILGNRKKGEDDVFFDDAQELVLERHLGAPQSEARRLAGILWNAEVSSIPKANRLDIGAES
jgi:hypothetical protein